MDDDAFRIVSEWTAELARDHLWGPADPLFPATEIGLDADGGFTPVGLARQCWRSTGPVRQAFRTAFEAVALPYYNPHSFRDMLVHHGMSAGLSPEGMKALSQNLGHSHVLTTFTSYGQVPTHRQGELIRAMGDLSAATIPLTKAQIAALKSFATTL